MNDDFERVPAHELTVSQYRKKNNGRYPSVYRVRCKRCGKELWGSGLGIGSHRRACKV